ncbi:MAG: twin-arginine translocase TatA/TatE family subunit [Candidatus Magnetomorum sp.]|nr:twin-arginine translocase TatA/TatE family subunit [Candidatus Magnetomorum sp.]
MFGMGMPEMILILAVALIVIGPKKLPELAKSLGKGIVEFKRATQDFRETINVETEVGEIRDTVDSIKTDIHQLTEKPEPSKSKSQATHSTSVKTAENNSPKPPDSELAAPYSTSKDTQSTVDHEK